MSAEEQPGGDGAPEKESYGQRGTLFLVIGFLVMVIGMWSWTYFILLERG